VERRVIEIQPRHEYRGIGNLLRDRPFGTNSLFDDLFLYRALFQIIKQDVF